MADALKFSCISGCINVTHYERLKGTIFGDEILCLMERTPLCGKKVYHFVGEALCNSRIVALFVARERGIDRAPRIQRIGGLLGGLRFGD